MRAKKSELFRRSDAGKTAGTFPVKTERTADLPAESSGLFRRAAPFTLLAAVLIWGFGYIVTKSVLHGVSPLLLTAVAYFYAAAAGLPVIVLRRKNLRRKNVLRNSAFLGVLLFCSRMIQVIGCKYTTAGKNAFITTAYVVIVPVLGWALFRFRLRIKNILLALMTLLGIGIIALNENFTGVNFGDVMTFVSSVGFGVHILYNGKYVEKNDPLLLGVMQIEFAAAISLVLAFAVQPRIPPDFFTWQAQAPFLYDGVMSTTAGFLLQSFGQKYMDSDRTARILSLESVSGALFSAAVLGEQYGVRLLIGCTIILAANLLTHLPRGKERRNRLRV